MALSSDANFFTTGFADGEGQRAVDAREVIDAPRMCSAAGESAVIVLGPATAVLDPADARPGADGQASQVEDTRLDFRHREFCTYGALIN